jgi:hypothetical protein
VFSKLDGLTLFLAPLLPASPGVSAASRPAEVPVDLEHADPSVSGQRVDPAELADVESDNDLFALMAAHCPHCQAEDSWTGPAHALY